MAEAGNQITKTYLAGNFFRNTKGIRAFESPSVCTKAFCYLSETS
jgi:hypothetical protein